MSIDIFFEILRERKEIARFLSGMAEDEEKSIK